MKTIKNSNACPVQASLKSPVSRGELRRSIPHTKYQAPWPSAMLAFLASACTSKGYWRAKTPYATAKQSKGRARSASLRLPMAVVSSS